MTTSASHNVTDAELQALTGKSWQAWCHLLDTWGGQTQSLVAITSYLIERQGLRRLWAQMIAVYYKRVWCAA